MQLSPAGQSWIGKTGMPTLNLEFLPNEANEAEGLNHPGIETYMDAPYASTARECGQNSSDAGSDLPVIINFDRVRISKSDLISQLKKTAPVTSRTLVYRVDFHYVREPYQDDVLAKNGALSDEDAEALTKRLCRMDRLSKHGAWTGETLSVIKKHPSVVSSKLASQLRRERAAFKIDVSKLKKLGLTISHEVGYELSPRGEAYLAYTKRHAS